MSKLVIDKHDLNYFGEYKDDWEDLAERVINFVKEETDGTLKHTIIVEVV